MFIAQNWEICWKTNEFLAWSFFVHDFTSMADLVVGLREKKMPNCTGFYSLGVRDIFWGVRDIFWGVIGFGCIL